MIRLPSSIKPYTEYWSEDPAFQQPPQSLPEDASAESRAAYDLAVAEYGAKLTAAIDTGDWSPLRASGGGEPTAFVVRVLTSEQLGKLSDKARSGTGDYEFLTHVFRLALQSLAPFDGQKIEHVDDPHFGRMVSLEWMEKVGIVGSHGLRLIREIGSRVFVRSSTLSPK